MHGITGQIGASYITAGSGSVVNNGTISSDGGGTITINPGTYQNASTGVISATGGTLIVSPLMNNVGTVIVAAGNGMTLQNGEAQTGGITQVDGTLTVNAAPITLNGGVLGGTGTINGNTPNVVNNSGTVKPGDSPGTLTISGNYTQGANGHQEIEYTNTAAGLLAVTGSATLGGVLDISYLGPAHPDGSYLINPGDPGSMFNFLTYGTLTNSGIGSLFSNEYTVGGSFYVNGIAADDVGANPAVHQLTQNGPKTPALTLTTAAAPEPSKWAAYGLGILGLTTLGLRARRRNVRA